MQKLTLYINDKKADIGEDFIVSLNYSFTDVERPTAVKNSFSKTVELLGTPNNNKIFEQYFDTKHKIISFNPAERIPFQLFLGSDLLEQGYIKLDSITRLNGIWRYAVTFYGSLGEFFYTLSSSTLEDLSTYFNIDISINKETVYNDWISYPQNDTKICWVPEYGGIYDDFNNDTIQVTQTDTQELGEELDQFQVGDFRSYMQRPAAYVGSIIEGICAQSGFDVSIDESFTTRSNPYWENLVCTFPLLDMSEKSQRWITNTFELNNKNAGPFGPTNSSFYFDYTYSTSQDFSSYNFIGPGLDTTFSARVATSHTDINEITCRLTLTFLDTVTGTVTNTKETILFLGPDIEYEPKENEQLIRMTSMQSYDSQYNTIMFYDPSTGVSSSSVKLRFSGDTVRSTYMTSVKPGLNIKLEGVTLFTTSFTGNILGVTYANPENFRSQKRIHFNDVAHNGIKQSDFLLSYAKTFGLLFKKDKHNKKIDILTRNSYFQNYNVLDWSDKLDLSKELTINPLTFDSKYYSFKFNDAKSSYLDAYNKDTGKIYGQKLIDTDYEINNETKELLSGTVFTQPITSTEYIWKYYYTEGINGVSYYANTIYDATPRPSNFDWDGHTRKRNNNDMQLYFRLQPRTVDYKIWLSDDTPMQVYSQEFNYVYRSPALAALYTKSVSSIPYYTDYIKVGDDGFNENFSLLFSKPDKTYNGMSYSDASAGIYSRFWEKYLTDLYDKNNKIVTAYFYLEPADMLNFDFKDFVFVDGVIYHVNNIYDYNPLKEQSTKVELVQVKDIDAYVNGQRYGGSISYYLRAGRTSGTFDSNGGSFSPIFSTNSPTGPYLVSNTNSSMLSYDSNTQIISVASYSGSSDRTGTMTFGILEDSTARVSVTITQTAQAIEYYLTPSSDSVSITWPAQTAYSNFSTNGTLAKSSGSSWLTVENGVVKAAENGNYFSQQVYSADRTGTIVVTLVEDNTKTSTISVFQEANYFVRTQRNPGVNLYSMNVGTASYIDVDPQLFSNGTITYVGVDVNWLTWDSINSLIEVNTNTGTSTRVGIMTFGVSEGTEELEFEIYQPGTSQYYITPTSTTQTITASSQNVFQFTTNGSLMIDTTYSSVDASWLDLETNISNYTFVTADENGLDYSQTVMSSQRTGTLHLTLAEDSNIDASITVIQAPTYYIRSGVNNRTGATYTYDPDSSASGSFDPDLYTNTAGTVHYFVQNDASNWLSYDPYAEMIYYTANTTGDERQGYVGFYIDESNDEQDFLIKQKGDAGYFSFNNINDTDIYLELTHNSGVTGSVSQWKTSLDDGSTWTTTNVTSYSDKRVQRWLIPAHGKLAFQNMSNDFRTQSAGGYYTCSLDCTGPFSLSGKISTLFGSPATAESKDASGDADGTNVGMAYVFRGSTNLVSAEDLVLDLRLNYSWLFGDCTSLTIGPKLPLTNLTNVHYNYMFYGCTSLTTAPELPATTLTNNCYASMFRGCTSLTTGPDLPATTLVQQCYYYMFQGCTGLNSLRVHATDISASNCLNNWLADTDTYGNGVLYVPQSMVNQYPVGDSGIPSTWDYGVIS